MPKNLTIPDADAPALLKHYFTISLLAEVEQAVEKSSPQQKQELMLFLGARLRAESAGLPEPRQFSREKVQSWLAEDEADLAQSAVEQDSVEIHSPRPGFAAKLRAQCEFSPSITEPSASASR